jgi:hypothetical protein
MPPTIQANNELEVSLKDRAPARRPYAAVYLLLVAPFMFACTSPTDPTGIVLRVTGPASVLVNQYSMLTVRAVNEHGAEVPVPQPLVWTSSDSTVASVASTGVIRGLRRGNTVITVWAGAVTSAVQLPVKARVKIALDVPGWFAALPLPMAVGDSVQFLAYYVDVFGAPIPELPSPTWISSNPGSVSVSTSGLAVGRDSWSTSAIIGSTADGRDSIWVSVGNAIAGLPATIRFANAVRGTGPVTFFPSKGAPVTLSFGESVERPIRSGLFHLTIKGADGNPHYPVIPTIIRTGERLELYALNEWGASPSFPGFAMGNGIWVVSVWGAAQVPPDSARVRFIQSSPFLTVYTEPPNAPASRNPISCYFDPGDFTDYLALAVGDFDFILKYKGFLTPEITRIRATAPGGRAVTYVVFGETAETAGLLAFPDP